MSSTILEGILPVLPTPFKDDGDVDLVAMRQAAQFCIDAGARGLVFPGVASEYDHLSSWEQLSLLREVCEVADGRIPVICGGGKGSPEEIGSNIKKAGELGVNVAMVLIPTQYAGDEAGALRFMLSVIELAQDVDIIMQNAPTPIGAGLDSEILARIVSASPSIKYVKEEALPSGPRITALNDAAADHLIGVIGGGGARYVIDELNRGAVAAMPAAEITDIHVKMWNAYKRGDVSEARNLYMRSLPLLVIQTIYRMRLTKYALTKRGILSNSIVRAPLPEFDAFDEVELCTQLESLSNCFDLAPLTPVAL
ncbi:MAG: dihydrodipicolinate synthase family protein [Opitutales bacterium]|nr:dihydrodipicolinate synthase family protein [Opitutales bacterium]